MRPVVLALVLGLAGSAGAAPPRSRPAPPKEADCKPPGDKTRLKLNLKPDSEVADVIAWYAAVTCTTVLVTSNVPLAGKKVTILAPTPITLAEMRRLFDAALDSVGLVAEPDGKFLRIIEARRARPAPIRR
jgi:hypothetical protein